MGSLDWIVLSSFLLFVAVYGVWKTRGKKDVQGYFLANKSTPWYAITISVMATQASGITFLSTPGQAYVDGMRFVQFYFGLPIAMIVLSITAVPIFHRLKVYTAYEYLEQRFDLKNRVLGSVLFLIQRGLAAGFTILAPALVISVILGWDFRLTIFITGGLVILYTAAGGTEAVSKTQLLQMIIISLGMGAALFMIFRRLPPDISLAKAVHVAGKLGRLNVVNFAFDWKDRYNFWSGLIGGAFVALSYFGTDQTQVQRYLSGRSVAQIRVGLLANGVLKVPMQFIILFIGAMVFVFYQFVTPPLFFNPVETAALKNSPYADAYANLEADQARLSGEKRETLRKMLAAIDARNDADLEDRFSRAPTNERIGTRPPARRHRAHQEKESPGRNQRHQLHFFEFRDPVFAGGSRRADPGGDSLGLDVGLIRRTQRLGLGHGARHLQTNFKEERAGPALSHRFENGHGLLGNLRHLFRPVRQPSRLLDRGREYFGVPLLRRDPGNFSRGLLFQKDRRPGHLHRGDRRGIGRLGLLFFYEDPLFMVHTHRLRDSCLFGQHPESSLGGKKQGH